MSQEKVRQSALILDRSEWLIAGGAVGLTLITAVLVLLHTNSVIVFIMSTAALALLAAMVGQATDQVGARLGSGATGVLQSALGNLPELFVGIFSLRAGLVDVLRAALVGSILGNSLFVLGLAFISGGLRNGTQRFSSGVSRLITTLTALAVSALTIPTLAATLHTPAAGHEDVLSIACAVILLLVFIASIPMSLQGGSQSQPSEGTAETRRLWPIWLAVTLLIVAGAGSALVSDWFVSSLTPAITFLHISPAFTGLVVVALAGNAVENVVGVRFALQNKMDYAISVILNSSLQVALGLIPLLVLLSFVLGGAQLTLVLAPPLIVGLLLSAFLSALIINDGESNWLEGLALVGLYCIIAISFWWG